MYTVDSTGVSSLSAVREEHVCPGDKLSVVCKANESVIIRWNVAIPGTNTTHNITRSVQIRGNDSGSIPYQTASDTIEFHFSRVSEPNSHPLISKLLINRVNVALNDTLIVCSRVSETPETQTTIVHIMGGKCIH